MPSCNLASWLLWCRNTGGSSVADAGGIKRVAQRIVETRKGGDRVVVVVSAIGDTTDELLDLANDHCR